MTQHGALKPVWLIAGVALLVSVIAVAPALFLAAPFVTLGVGLWLRSAPVGSSRQHVGQRVIRGSCVVLVLFIVGAIIGSTMYHTTVYRASPILVSSR